MERAPEEAFGVGPRRQPERGAHRAELVLGDRRPRRREEDEAAHALGPDGRVVQRDRAAQRVTKEHGRLGEERVERRDHPRSPHRHVNGPG